MTAILLLSYEPSSPFGAKPVAEIPINAVTPAVANALFDADRVSIRLLPLTTERVWRVLQDSG